MAIPTNTCAGGDVCPRMSDNTSTLSQDLHIPPNLEWHVLSQDPYVVAMDDFISSAEAEQLIELASDGRLKEAMVKGVQGNTATSNLESEVRSGKTAFLKAPEENSNPLLQHIIKRIHRLTYIPQQNGESQVANYKVGQKFTFHRDSSNDFSDMNNQRLATFIVYLNDVEAGGETIFPHSYRVCDQSSRGTRIGPDGKSRSLISHCCELNWPGVLKIPPRRGRAVLFFNHHYFTQELNQKSQHAGCPVQAGDKWIFQRFLFTHPYQKVGPKTFDARFDGLPWTFNRPVVDRLEVRVLSQQEPSLYMVDGVLNEAECTYLQELAERRLAEQKKVGNTGSGVERVVLTRENEVKDEVISRIVKRMHRLVHAPEAHGESLELVKYSAGHGQEIHFDSSQESTRPLSLFVYVSGDGTNAIDGASFFPREHCKTLAKCCRAANKTLERRISRPKIITVPPLAGRAVFFKSHTLEQSPDFKAEHGMCPAGDSAIWIVERLFKIDKTHSPKFQPDRLFDGFGSLRE